MTDPRSAPPRHHADDPDQDPEHPRDETSPLDDVLDLDLDLEESDDGDRLKEGFTGQER